MGVLEFWAKLMSVFLNNIAVILTLAEVPFRHVERWLDGFQIGESSQKQRLFTTHDPTTSRESASGQAEDGKCNKKKDKGEDVVEKADT